MRRLPFHVLTSVVLILLHTTLVPFIVIGNAIPDILLIWIVYLAITRGQIAGTLAGFLLGLTVDIISGNDGMLGLGAIAKTVAGFLAGYFYNENKTEQTLGSSGFILAVGLAAALHSAIYFLIFLRAGDVGWWQSIVLHGMPSAAYTTALAVIPMSLFRRKYR